LKGYLQYRNVVRIRNVLFGDVTLFACPPRIVMDAAMARKTQSQAMHEIIEPLADPASFVMAFGCDCAADLTLDMFSRERQPQAAVFPQPGCPDLAHPAQPGFGFERAFPLQ
jgi:hypothetical protein